MDIQELTIANSGSFDNQLPEKSHFQAVSSPVPNYYIHAATADNTRKAYQSDIRQFLEWGGFLPTTIEQTIHYLHEEAPRLSAATLSRRITAISHWHTTQGMNDPTLHPMIRKTLKGILKVHGKPAQKAPALTLSHIETIAATLKQYDTLSALRNSALIQVGFFGAFRRSELAAIQLEQVFFVDEGVEILLPRSKTDQDGQGSLVALPFGHALLCPVKALQAWLEAAAIKKGYVFCGISKSEQLRHNGLTPGSIGYILKGVLDLCDIDNASTFSGHSLRRGFATEASRQSLSLPEIMRHGRWKSEKTVIGYIEEGQRFIDNPAKKLLNSHHKP